MDSDDDSDSSQDDKEKKVKKKKCKPSTSEKKKVNDTIFMVTFTLFFGFGKQHLASDRSALRAVAGTRICICGYCFYSLIKH